MSRVDATCEANLKCRVEESSTALVELNDDDLPPAAQLGLQAAGLARVACRGTIPRRRRKGSIYIYSNMCNKENGTCKKVI